TFTCCSFTHALRMPRTVLFARLRHCWMASSKLVDDVALISLTLAMVISLSSDCCGDQATLVADCKLVVRRPYGPRVQNQNCCVCKRQQQLTRRSFESP